MAARDRFDRLIADFAEVELPDLTPRRLTLPRLAGRADVVIGMRRSGKTWFLYQNLKELLAGPVPRERLLYVNFEDDRLLPLAAGDLADLPEAFYRRHPDARDQEHWFFFDEIQNVPGWEIFVRRLLDTEKVRVTITGSSSRLLGREIATALRGRSLSTELLPFSYREALDHFGLDVDPSRPPSSRLRSHLEHRLLRFLESGGLPEVQRMDAATRLRVLQEHVDVVLFRDIVERHGVTNVPALRFLARRFVGAPATRYTVNRLHRDLRSQGLRVGKDSVHEYVSHLEDAFLLFSVPIHARSERARSVNPRQGYLFDHGLAVAGSYRAAREVGHLLENVVAVELRRRGYALSYVSTRSGFEVDFLAERADRDPRLVQVCADLSDRATRERELRALSQAMEELGLGAGVVVTLGGEEEVRVPGGAVRVEPAWRWLLGPG